MLLTSVIVALATAMMMPPKPSMAPSPRCQASRCTAVAGEEADFLEDAEIFADTVASFAAIDLNGDGEISHAELRDHMLGCGYANASVDEIFSTLDLNEDGVLTLEELAEGFTRHEVLRAAPGLGWDMSEEPTSSADADAIFAAMDADGDDEVSLQECAAYLEATRGYTVEAVGAIFETLDLNSDGAISKAEWQDACMQYSALRHAFGLHAGGKPNEIALRSGEAD